MLTKIQLLAILYFSYVFATAQAQNSQSQTQITNETVVVNSTSCRDIRGLNPFDRISTAKYVVIKMTSISQKHAKCISANVSLDENRNTFLVNVSAHQVYEYKIRLTNTSKDGFVFGINVTNEMRIKLVDVDADQNFAAVCAYSTAANNQTNSTDNSLGFVLSKNVDYNKNAMDIFLAKVDCAEIHMNNMATVEQGKTCKNNATIQGPALFCIFLMTFAVLQQLL